MLLHVSVPRSDAVRSFLPSGVSLTAKGRFVRNLALARRWPCACRGAPAGDVLIRLGLAWWRRETKVGSAVGESLVVAGHGRGIRRLDAGCQSTVGAAHLVSIVGQAGGRRGSAGAPLIAAITLFLRDRDVDVRWGGLFRGEGRGRHPAGRVDRADVQSPHPDPGGGSTFRRCRRWDPSAPALAGWGQGWASRPRVRCCSWPAGHCQDSTMCPTRIGCTGAPQLRHSKVMTRFRRSVMAGLRPRSRVARVVRRVGARR